MFLGRVRPHLVDDHFQAERVRLLDHGVELVKGAKDWIDAKMITDVVTKVAHRRCEKWRQPEAVDAETRHVIETPEDAREVADAVAIAVLEAARIDLVQGGAAPPVGVLHDRTLRDCLDRVSTTAPMRCLSWQTKTDCFMTLIDVTMA